MRPTDVRVPAKLILDQDLPASAKLLWIIIQLGAPADPTSMPRGRLQDRSGLSLPTIRRGLAQLKSAGWLPLVGQPAGPLIRKTTNSAILSSDLLLAQHLSVQAKLLFGTLQLTPNFRGTTGVTTIPELSALTGLAPLTLREAAQELRQQGWLKVQQSNKFKPIHFTLNNPIANMRAQDVELAQLRLDENRHKAEALMREFLSLLVESNDFEDNATPGFLVNPYTDEEMQFDRYYPVGVAFEYNGEQHYHTTALYSKEIKVRKQMGRDLMKQAICMQRSITLVVVHLEDLSLEGMRQKVPSQLPLRDLEGHQPLATYLESLGRRFRRKGGY